MCFTAIAKSSFKPVRVAAQCERNPFAATKSDKFGIWIYQARSGAARKTVERLYYEQAEQAINLPERYAKVRKLGIDELSLHKGKGNYCCVLTDLDRGAQLDILADRKKETLVAHFQGLGLAFCQQIKHALAAICRGLIPR